MKNNNINQFKNPFVQKVICEEKLAIIRANNIREKYKLLRDKKIAERLDLIFKTSRNDLELATNLQKYYYLLIK